MISKLVPTKGTKKPSNTYLDRQVTSEVGWSLETEECQKPKQDQNITPNMWNKIIHLIHMYLGAQLTA